VRLGRRQLAEAVAAALAGSLIGVTFVGAHGDPSLNLHSCHAPNGVVDLIPSPAPDDPQPCPAGQELDEWSVIGQATNDGARGARGAVGPAGPQGPPGPAGHDGPRYTFRIATSAGSGSATARCGAGEPAVAGGWSTRSGANVTGGGRSAPGAWTVEATGARGRGAKLTVYAICAKAVKR
jgi:hypothetical protein